MSENSNYRFERKFLVNNKLINTKSDLERFLNKNLIQIYNTRKINSIYYDTNELKLANDSLEGIYNKEKVRIRFYGNPKQINLPKLEIKIKNGNMGKKEIISLNNYDLYKNNFLLFKISQNINFKNNYINRLLNIVKPIFFISYNRHYYHSECLKFRFTLDENICFKSLITDISISNLDKNLNNSFKKEILEFKYNYLDEKIANSFLRRLPFRLTSFSKYTMGLNHLGLL